MPIAMTESERAGWIRQTLDEYERPLLSYARWLLRDTDKATDAVADTFARLCGTPGDRANAQDPATLNGDLSRWLFAVCRNRAIDMIRKDKRMKPLTDNAIATLQRPADRKDDPGHAIEADDEHVAALRALADLPDTQQEVIRLKFQHDLSYKDIAAVTGLTVTNVGYLLHTGLKKLREQLSTH